MFSRISRSWELVKASWAVLRADKELILFPILSFVGTIIVTITFLVPMALAGIFDQAQEQGGIPVAGYIVGFAFYVVMYTVIIFSNTALVGAAMMRLRGEDPSVSDGFRIAFSHLGVILQYAVISATVGMVLRALRERGGIVGAITAAIGGIAWNVVTFLVIPVLVVENVNPIDAIKRSGSLLKQTWGEQVIVNFGIGTVFGLITLAVIIPGVLLTIAAASVSIVLAIALGAMTVLVVIGVNLIGSALNGIFVAALYQYATAGNAGTYFNETMVREAFVIKR